MLTEEDKALWEIYSKTITPLVKASKLKVFRQNFSFRFSPKKTENAFVPYILDLHGFSLQEGFCLFERFLNYHVRKKTKKIVIITGKGKDGTGLLKQEFPKWIENPTVKKKIRSMSLPVSYGGGAFELILKNKE